MVEVMIAFVTCGSREEATRIAEALVQDHLVACVNVIPSVESCYRWEGNLKWDTEFLLLLKTTEDAIDRVHERVIKEHSYDLPEFVAFKIDEGAGPYLKWIEESIEA
jgi:periplasmic divalent cation tolerance protein